MKIAMGLAFVLAALAPAGDLTVGGDVPDTTFKTIDGKELKLSELCKEGNVVAIASWSFDCGSTAIGRIHEVGAKFADNKKVTFIGVNGYGEKADAVASYCKEKSVSIPIVHDADKSIHKLFSAKQVNSAYVIVGNKLFWRGGAMKNGKDAFAEAIQAALDGKPAPASDKKFGG